MASNFRILTHRSNGHLQLELMGDFDGSSAFELINALKECCGKAEKVTVKTGGLSSIHPFGSNVFQKQCSLNKLCRSLIFTGKYGDAIAPQGVTAS